MRMKLVSVHLPKTAGTSFGKSLLDRFGDAFLRDYGDRAISKPEFERHKLALLSSIEIANKGLGNVSCIHGHFLPVKYLLLGTLEKLTFITWMREPVDRMISHYNFWQRAYDPATAAPHHRQVIEERWTLEDFCLSPRFRNLYSQYLWAFPLDNFAFIGITEHYEDDLAYFGDHVLGVRLRTERLNTAEIKTSPPRVDAALRRRIEKFHEADCCLYRRALELRQARCSEAPPDNYGA